MFKGRWNMAMPSVKSLRRQEWVFPALQQGFARLLAVPWVWLRM